MDKQRGKGLGEFNIKKRGSSKMVYGLSRTGIKGGGGRNQIAIAQSDHLGT